MPGATAAESQGRASVLTPAADLLRDPIKHHALGMWHTIGIPEVFEAAQGSIEVPC